MVNSAVECTAETLVECTVTLGVAVDLWVKEQFLGVKVLVHTLMVLVDGTVAKVNSETSNKVML